MSAAAPASSGLNLSSLSRAGATATEEEMKAESKIETEEKRKEKEFNDNVSKIRTGFYPLHKELGPEYGVIAKGPKGQIVVIVSPVKLGHGAPLYSDAPTTLNGYMVDGIPAELRCFDEFMVDTKKEGVLKVRKKGGISDNLLKSADEQGNIYISVFDRIKELADERVKEDEQRAARTQKANVLYRLEQEAPVAKTQARFVIHEDDCSIM